MRDYAGLVKALRETDFDVNCEYCDRDPCVEDCYIVQAADAIEELVTMACPHYHRNVHDRGDDSYCDVLNTEPPKEETE